jgi:two-component sensor histidine kinase
MNRLCEERRIMSVEASPVYLTIQWKDLPASIRVTDHADGATRSGRLHDSGLDAASRLPVTIPATTDDGRIVSLSIASDEDRSFDIVTQTEAVHRSRNLVSLAIALARLSLAPLGANPVVAAFIDRLRSLDAVARIGCEVTGDYCSIQQVTAQVTARFDDPQRPRVAQSGSSVALAARWANLIAIVLHELCANAIRHGALTSPLGRVDVRWALVRSEAGDATLHLTWREIDGPPVSMPAKTGFGSRLLRDLIASNRRCEAIMRLPPSGLVYSLSIKLMRDEWRE